MFRVPPEGGEAVMGGRVECLKTAHENPHIFTASNLELYENFVVDLERRLQLLNIGMYTMHAECGRGQVEVGCSWRHCSLCLCHLTNQEINKTSKNEQDLGGAKRFK